MTLPHYSILSKPMLTQGSREWLPGGLPEAKARFGARCAAGRLGLVHKEGSPPRLIGDSTICNANLFSRVSEKIELPTLEDVAEFISRHPQDEWMAFVLDVCKVHKRVKVHPSEQGFSIFTVVDCRWEHQMACVYKTCHFGCAWAAFWWARVAAGLVRLRHRLIAVIRHFLAIYVDDSLSLLPSHSAPTLACLQIILACALGVPVSWHKLYLGRHVRWIGWLFNLDGKALCVATGRTRWRGLLPRCGRWPGQAPSTAVAACSPLWGCYRGTRAGPRWLRPWMAIWFHMLLKPAFTLCTSG